MTDSFNFSNSPWAKESQHKAYRGSIFSIIPAPEYANSEVLLASLYRTIGFKNSNEGNVPKTGRDLIERMQKLKERHGKGPSGSTVDVEAWSSVLQGVLESPKLPNQSSKRFIQVTPLVPSLALFSGSARLSSNSWPAGSLIRRMISMGSRDQTSASSLWESLFLSLTVTEDDDVFARWLEQEVHSWSPESKWEYLQLDESQEPHLELADFDSIVFFPARAFVRDLKAVIDVKNSMTRRQWTSLLEAIIRIACVSHVIWLCDVQARIWSVLLDALDGGGPTTVDDVKKRIFPSAPRYLPYGGKALNGIKDKISGYLEARLGINSLLWSLGDAGVQINVTIGSSQVVHDLCERVRKNRQSPKVSAAKGAYYDLREGESKALSCKKGIGANLMEFARHVLGQRQTAEELLRGYDQSYFLRKRGAHSSSPWVVSLGPVAVLSFVHCSLYGMAGPRSIHRLGQHLATYGLALEGADLTASELGQQLRMLGLVLDSPDAESGMLLLAPFEVQKTSVLA